MSVKELERSRPARSRKRAGPPDTCKLTGVPGEPTSTGAWYDVTEPHDEFPDCVSLRVTTTPIPAERAVRLELAPLMFGAQTIPIPRVADSNWFRHLLHRLSRGRRHCDLNWTAQFGLKECELHLLLSGFTAPFEDWAFTEATDDDDTVSFVDKSGGEDESEVVEKQGVAIGKKLVASSDRSDTERRKTTAGHEAQYKRPRTQIRPKGNATHPAWDVRVNGPGHLEKIFRTPLATVRESRQEGQCTLEITCLHKSLLFLGIQADDFPFASNVTTGTLAQRIKQDLARKITARPLCSVQLARCPSV